MAKPILGLRTAAYQVNDLEKAKSWYTEVFQTEPYFSEPFYVGFNIGGFELGLQPTSDLSKKKAASVLTYWGVENILEQFKRLLQLGATVHEEPQNVGGNIEVASVYDPWGNILGIIYNPYFKMEE